MNWKKTIRSISITYKSMNTRKCLTLNYTWNIYVCQENSHLLSYGFFEIELLYWEGNNGELQFSLNIVAFLEIWRAWEILNGAVEWGFCCATSLYDKCKGSSF